MGHNSGIGASVEAALSSRLASLEARISELESRILVEPLYDRALLPTLIPCTESALTRALKVYSEDFPKRFRRVPNSYRKPDGTFGTSRVRMFTAKDINRLRKLFIEGL